MLNDYSSLKNQEGRVYVCMKGIKSMMHMCNIWYLSVSKMKHA